MICPVCDQAMVIVEYQEIELDYCTNCKGVWFDSGELELLLASAGHDDSQEYLNRVTGKPEAVTTEKKRKCPICTKKMGKTYIDDGGEVLVDICPYEHGIWFDGQEVNQLLKHLAQKSPDKEESSREVMDFLADIFKY